MEINAGVDNRESIRGRIIENGWTNIPSIYSHVELEVIGMLHKIILKLGLGKNYIVDKEHIYQ